MQNGFEFLCRTRAGVGFAGLWLAVVVCFASGCGQEKKSLLPPAGSPPEAIRPVLAIHWIGKTRLAQDTNAAYQMMIWKMPESERLEKQTLDKLARALPAILGAKGVTGTNALDELLRPLLDDLVQAESFAELRAPTNRPMEFALAIRLAAERAALWQTHVLAFNQALAAGATNPGEASRSLQLKAVGDWVVLGLGSADSVRFANFANRFAATNLSSSDTNWVELEADLSVLCRSNSVFPAQSLPFVHLALAGDGQDVRTRGELTFPNPLEIELGRWNIPTNLIHDPLVSFTALRGVQSWLRSLKTWNDWQLGPPPDQLYFWAQPGVPQETFIAGALPAASNWVHTASGNLSGRFIPWLATNGMGTLKEAEDGNGFVWPDFPFLSLYLRSLALAEGNFAFGGFLPTSRTNQPFPAELLQAISARTNLVYYDWEIVGSRAKALLFIGQGLRFAFNKAQLPFDSASLGWLTNAAPMLGNCLTTLAQTGPAQLSLVRKSGVGFSALELHLVADWLESPEFPRGWHTFLVPPETTLHGKRKEPGFRSAPATNTPPVRPVPAP